MLEHSPYSSPRYDLCVDLELRLLIDECQFLIRPVRKPRKTTVQWECCHCGQSQVLSASPGLNTEALLSYGKGEAWKHMVHAHPGPETNVLLRDL
jgi:hypothetical protein